MFSCFDRSFCLFVCLVSLRLATPGSLPTSGLASNYYLSNLDDRARNLTDPVDHAVYGLRENVNSERVLEIDYEDSSDELFEDLQSVAKSYEKVESSEDDEVEFRSERSLKMSENFHQNDDDRMMMMMKVGRDRPSGKEKSKFGKYFRSYKIKKALIDNDEEVIKFKNYLRKMEDRKNDARKRRPRHVTLQSLNEINQFLLTALQTVRSWLVYEVNGRSPEPKMSHEKLLQAFEIYYECLNKKLEFYKENLGQPMNDIEAFNTLSNEKVVIQCKTCLPPFTNGRDYGLVWYRRLLSEGGSYRHLPEDENLFSVSVDGDLTMHQLRSEDAGMYTCFKGEAHEATYLIGVDDAESRIRVYEDTESMARATQPIIMAEFNLYVSYQWSQWSNCNRCNGKGVRKRVGTCMIKKYDKRLPIRPKDSIIFKKLTNGLPCISPLIPHFIYEDAGLSKRRTELMLATCYNVCVTIPPVKVITDVNGKKIDVVKVYKGRHSFYDGIPQLGVPIERITQHATLDRKFIISCPHANASKMSIRWQNGTSLLDESKLGYTTGFRVKINARNEIVIKKALKYDEGYYSCWHYLQHLGTVKLFVAESLDWRYYWDLYLRQMGLFACSISFIYILLKLIVLRFRAPYQLK